MTNIILKIQAQTYFHLFICLIVLLLSLFYLIKKKHLTSSRLVISGILIVISINVLMFWNPLFFVIASHVLKASDIGWRQADALRTELYRFYKKDREIKYLAIGSSQTGALYARYARSHQDFSVLTMAGMGPLDFFLYRDIIKSMCNGTLILTLSDFDIGRKPMLLGAKLAPPQGFHILEITPFLHKEPNISNSEIQDMVVANFIDAYRYQYIFKGVLDKVFKRNKAFPEKDETAPSNKEFFKIHLQSLQNLNQKWFNINLLLLDIFMKWANQNSLKVIVVEGQYHPRALNANITLHNKASFELESLCKRYKNIQYVKDDKLYGFSEDDYRDGYHVKDDAGYKFSLTLMNSLVRSN